jgi:hypothetical protein
MFESNKGRYLTRGVDAEIPQDIQLIMWEAIGHMPEPKDYLQVFRLSVANVLQVIHHTAEQPNFEMTYVLATVDTYVTEKVYVIDDHTLRYVFRVRQPTELNMKCSLLTSVLALSRCRKYPEDR